MNNSHKCLTEQIHYFQVTDILRKKLIQKEKEFIETCSLEFISR